MVSEMHKVFTWFVKILYSFNNTEFESKDCGADQEIITKRIEKNIMRCVRPTGNIGNLFRVIV